MQVINKQAEKKNLDQTSVDTDVSQTSAFQHQILMPAQGDTDETRDGDQIRLLSIRFKLHIELLGVATEGAVVRLVLMRLPNNNVDGVTVETAFLNLLRPNDFYPRQLSFKYQVLHDKNYSIGGGGKSSMLVSISKKMNTLIQFNGTGQGDVQNYQYILFGQTNHPTASELSIDSNSRIIYTDS